jgi:hypothetical protein
VSLVSSLATTDDADEISLVATFKGAHADASPQSFRHPPSANKGERGKHLSAPVRAPPLLALPMLSQFIYALRLPTSNFATPYYIKFATAMYQFFVSYNLRCVSNFAKKNRENLFAINSCLLYHGNNHMK